MKALDFIYPIFRDIEEGIDFIGNGFFADNLFITADHVLKPNDCKAGSDPYIVVDSKKYVLRNKASLDFKKITLNENNQMQGYEDEGSADIAAFVFDDLKISSPLFLSDSLPEYGQTLHSDFYHRLQVGNNKEQKTVVINSQKMYIWETTGLVWGEEGFCGNFFGATMKPKHPSGGSSGSPIYDGNIVYGILHNGGEDLCGFYSSTHALKLLRQHQCRVYR